jgi:hypothetical protein
MHNVIFVFAPWTPGTPGIAVPTLSSLAVGVSTVSVFNSDMHHLHDASRQRSQPLGDTEADTDVRMHDRQVDMHAVQVCTVFCTAPTGTRVTQTRVSIFQLTASRQQINGWVLRGYHQPVTRSHCAACTAVWHCCGACCQQQLHNSAAIERCHCQWYECCRQSCR